MCLTGNNLDNLALDLLLLELQPLDISTCWLKSVAKFSVICIRVAE
jgi:hypothetical protein